MMTYTFDVEQFIREIENRPVIWDSSCEDNRHKNKKQRAWEEIAKKFIQDFDNLPSVEKDDVFRKLHGKWRNIRDSYVRNTKKKGGQKQYMYAKHLSFLDTLYRPSDNQTDEDEWSEDGEPKKRRSNRFNDEWQSESENSMGETKRKRVKKEVIPLEYIEEPLMADSLNQTFNFPGEDEDKSFFDSLLPAVRSFDLDHKLEFRSEVLNLIKNIRRKQNKSNSIELDG